MGILIPLPTFPNVPIAPGVPQLTRIAGGIAGGVAAVNAAVSGVNGAMAAANSILGGLPSVAGALLSANAGVAGINAAAGLVNAGFASAAGLAGAAVAGLSGALASAAGAAAGLVNAVAGLGGAVAGAADAAADLVGSIDDAADATSGLGAATSSFGDDSANDPVTSDAPDLPAGVSTQKWGLFTAGGTDALMADQTFSFELKKEWKLANFPLEAGAFASYNKVIVPFENRLVVKKGGSQAERAAFLQNADAIAASLTLYTVVTPEVSYPNVNVAGYTITRTAEKGLTLIAVEFRLQQINPAGAAMVTTTASVNGAATTNDGPVQATPPTSGQSSAISNSGPPQPPATQGAFA